MTQEYRCHHCNIPLTFHRGVGDFRDYYSCSQCNRRVGCHRGTNEPLGTVADAELRVWRRRAHKAFDTLWKQRAKRDGCERKEARAKGYKWLSEQMGISGDKCHIAMFEIAECQRVVSLCEPYLSGVQRR